MITKTILTATTVLVLSACHFAPVSKHNMVSRAVKDKPVAIIYRDSQSKDNYLQIEEVISNHCICADVIAEQYLYGRIVYRFYYGCSLYKTRKEIFRYCSQGAPGQTAYDGIEEPRKESFIPLDKRDQLVLHKIDSFIQIEDQSSRLILCKKQIAGFSRAEYLDSTRFWKHSN